MTDDAFLATAANSHESRTSQDDSSVGPSAAKLPTVRRLHVVHVVSSLEVGGQEKVVLDLSRGLASRGHAVTVISLAEGGTLRPLFGPIPTQTVARAEGGLDFRLLARLRRVFRDLLPDVVHTHNPTALLYGVTSARAAGVPRVVHTKHGANPTHRRAMLLTRRLLYRSCDRVVAVSDETAQIAKEFEGLRAPRLTVIPNGIDVDAYAKTTEGRARTRAALRIPAEAIVLGTVGRLAPEKNQVLLIEAAAPLLGERLHLVLVGEGPMRSRLESAVPKESQRYVHFTGVRSDVAQLLAGFDIFVLTSNTEGLPLVVPEAMAANLPVVCTAVGGLPSVVLDGVSGRLIRPGDALALRTVLSELCGDEPLRYRLAKGALSTARQRFSLDQMISRYEAVYR